MRSVILLLVFSIATIVVGQAPQDDSPADTSQSPNKIRAIPPVGDLEVFYLYLVNGHTIISSVGKAPRKTKENAAANLHVQTAELDAIDSTYRQATAAITAAHNDTSVYRRGVLAVGGKLDHAILESYYDRRVKALRAAREQLAAALGPRRWSDVASYIDGDFRKTIKVEVMQWKN